MNNFRYVVVAVAATALLVAPSFASEIPAPPFETAVEHSNAARDTQNGQADNNKPRQPTDAKSGAAAPDRADSKENAGATASDKVRKWTRARWNAARKSWSDKNAKFYACSADWRKSNGGRKYAFHDQRESIFRCMNDGEG